MFKIGDKVLVKTWDGKLVPDVIRMLFMQHVLLEPYGRNYYKSAAVLTNHSWAFLKDLS